jgi:hypothetical protein
MAVLKQAAATQQLASFCDVIKYITRIPRVTVKVRPAPNSIARGPAIRLDADKNN